MLSSYRPKNISRSSLPNAHVIQLISSLFQFKDQTIDMSLPTTRKIIGNFTYSLADKIGSGFSSQVYRGLDQKANEQVALKVVPKLGHRSDQQLQLAETQIRALNLVKGTDNILELKQALQTKSSIYIITELCSRGTLKDVILKERRLAEATAVAYIMQIIEGYKNIHKEGLIHRDIKPDNIFITEDDAVRIGDFGFAIAASECQHALPQNIGSPLFMPYESLADNLYSFKSDIWAIGVTFLEMITGKVPWRSKTEKELIAEIKNLDIQRMLPSGISACSQQFLRRTLVRQEERMTPEQLFAFSFENINNTTKDRTNLKKTLSLQVVFKNQLAQKSTIKQELSAAPAPKKDKAIANHIKMTSSSYLTPSQLTKTFVIKENSEQSTQEHSKHDFQKIAEIQSHQQLDLLSKQSGSQKLVNSVTLEAKEKPKTKINRKYSQMCSNIPIKDASTSKPNDSSSKAQTEQKICQAKLSAKRERQMLVQIQSQMGYFRFTFKLFKKMNEILKTTDHHIAKFKQNLLYITHSKMEEIRLLTNLTAEEEEKESFQATAQYANILEVLRQYRQRYVKEEEKWNIMPGFSGEEDFIRCLSYTLKVLYQNIVSIQQREDEFHRKKSLVFIVQDLVKLSNLYILERQHDWNLFHHSSDIMRLIETPHEQTNLHSQWGCVKESVRQLISI